MNVYFATQAERNKQWQQQTDKDRKTQKSDTGKRTRSPAVARIADRTGCQWPSRSSKVDDF